MKRNTLNTFISATLIMLLGVSSSAKAVVPAGNLMGTTSVTWGGETASEIQTSIQSILVPAAPILSEPDNQTRIPADKSIVTLEYTITSNANGKDTYSLSSAAAPEGVEATGSTAPSPASVTLGATAAMEAADAGEDAIKVPSDGVIDDAVNGITNGDTVFINKNEYTVGAVVDDGNTATITLTSGLQAPLAFGDRIAEQQTFEVTLDNVGTITEDAETGTVTITVTATSTSPGAPAADDDVVLTLLTPVGPSVEKYVRNLTDPDSNPTDPGEIGDEAKIDYDSGTGSNSYFKESVSVKENDTLEYLIVLKAGNQGEQSNITLNESLPPFASYLPASAKINNESIEDNDDGTSPALSGDWTVASAEGPLTIDTNGLAYITYQVTVIGEQPTVPGGDGGEPEIAATYKGCQPQYANPVEFCVPDGTRWADVVGEATNTIHAQHSCAAFGDCFRQYTACWEGEDADGRWVVGVNGIPEIANSTNNERRIQELLGEQASRGERLNKSWQFTLYGCR